MRFNEKAPCAKCGKANRAGRRRRRKCGANPAGFVRIRAQNFSKYGYLVDIGHTTEPVDISRLTYEPPWSGQRDRLEGRSFVSQMYPAWVRKEQIGSYFRNLDRAGIPDRIRDERE